MAGIPDAKSYAAAVGPAVAAVRAAGEKVRAGVGSATVVGRKGSADYVTQLDYEVQEFLTKQLECLVPGAEIVGEESENQSYGTDKPLWILDPIDGTTNLLHRHPYLAISLALCHGQAVLGIVYNPMTDELFTAQKGGGAFLNGVRISVSGNTSLGQCLIGFGLPYDRSRAPSLFGNVQRVFSHCQDLRRCGSASLDLAHVACGRLDGYFEVDLHPWDVLAGMMILQEAGGIATTWTGGAIPLAGSSDVVASNGRVQSQLLDALSDI